MKSNIQMNFGKISDDKLEFLKLGIAKNSCKICNEKGNLTVLDDNVIIENICCEEYSKIIQGSLTNRNINSYAVEFRGKFINTYCFLESFIDDIIDIHFLKFNLKIKDKTGRERFEIGIREKKQLFKICLDNYNKETEKSIEKIWGNFNNIIKTRNCLSHWMVDTSPESVKLIKRNKIRFVNRIEMEIIDQEIFDAQKVSKLIIKIENLTTEITEIYKFYRNYLID